MRAGMREERVFFSILVVSKEGGEKLVSTVENALAQSHGGFEVLVKEAGLREAWDELFPAPRDERLRLHAAPDRGIYEGMNQAAALAKGDYFLFLNCGDLFAAEDILQRTEDFLKEHPGALIAYGDRRLAGAEGVDPGPGSVTPFSLFRGIPCHQSCFYHRSLFEKGEGYDVTFKIRGDQEHFFRSYFASGKAGERFPHMPFPVCVYEGGGFSEAPENQELSRREHREICRRYLSPGQRFLYRAYLVATLQPLRKRMASSRLLGGLYRRLKGGLKR